MDDCAEEKVVKEKKSLMEPIIAVMLAITALLTAWASYIDSLYTGTQADNLTVSGILASEGNAIYNEMAQKQMQDALTCNELNSLRMEIGFFGEDSEFGALALLKYNDLRSSLNGELLDAFMWAESESDTYGLRVSPFDYTYVNGDGDTVVFVEDYYYKDANALIRLSEAVLNEGRDANDAADRYGLVTVCYSLVLFLLGISGTFTAKRPQLGVVIIACVIFVAVTAFMLTIPLPADFSMADMFT